MKNWEDELKIALNRKDPSADFVDKVMARLEESAVPARNSWWTAWFNLPRRPVWHWACASVALCLLLGVGGLWFQHRQEEMRQGEVAKAQVLRALQITSHKLNLAQRRIQNLRSPHRVGNSEKAF
jgi:hypothetical protein